MEVNAKMFWNQMEDAKVDLIFEEVQNVLITLKQKIKDGSATHDECCQALALVKHADITDLLPLTNVVNVAVEEMQKRTPSLHPSTSTEDVKNPGESFSLSKCLTHFSPDFSCATVNRRMEIRDSTQTMSKGEPAEMEEMSSKFLYQDHICSKECLALRPRDSYKSENPLILPMLYHFQRRHAKTDFVSKSHDVIYKAPCGRSLRNFQDVQNYLFETECNFLFLDNFSFNTYVQVFRNSPTQKAFVFDFDISEGAENIPVSFCNNIDHNQLPYFKYRKVSLPHGYLLSSFSRVFFDSCNCTDGCTDRTKCACLLLTEGNCCDVSISSRKETSNGYTYKRLDEPIPSGIYECSLLCTCDKILCQNRLVQHGLQVRLQVFNAENKGWGVRCLDDIDKGTFVCTYSGRLMSRDKSIQCKDSDENEEEDIENSDRNPNLLSKKRKLDTVCSDSETEFFQSPEKEKSLHLQTRDLSSIIQNYNLSKSWNNKAIRRPKIRTSVLQSHQRQLGNNNFSSDEDEMKMYPKSVRKLTTAAMKGEEKSSQLREHVEVVNTVQSEAKTDCLKENLHSHIALNSMSDVQGSALIKLGTDDQESAYNKETIKDKKTCLNNNSYLLNATTEGNVGRFLNHSCSPNLFVQSVFVETHNRNFPWVAFFTNRHVKAGTELTWDYGYQARDMPEIEMACQCGSPKCRKKIL